MEAGGLSGSPKVDYYPRVSSDVAFPGPLTRHGAIMTARMKIHKNDGKIVLSQKTRLWFRAAVCVWASVVLTTPFWIYWVLFNSQTTRFTCDRGDGVCAVDGRTQGVPRLDDLARAEMDHNWNRRDGVNWGINLVTRDGKKYRIEQQRAIKDSVVADYRAAVKAINAYLHDPAQQKLEVSYTYWAALSEKLQSIFYLFFGVGTLLVGWNLWRRRVYIFEPGKITVVVRHPFDRETKEYATDRITAIAERQFMNRRFVDLKLDDMSVVRVVEAWREEAPFTDQVAKELAGILGRPVETAPG